MGLIKLLLLPLLLIISMVGVDGRLQSPTLVSPAAPWNEAER